MIVIWVSLTVVFAGLLVWAVRSALVEVDELTPRSSARDERAARAALHPRSGDVLATPRRCGCTTVPVDLDRLDRELASVTGLASVSGGRR